MHGQQNVKICFIQTYYRQTDRHDEANSLSSQFCERAKNGEKVRKGWKVQTFGVSDKQNKRPNVTSNTSEYAQ
jgi:hypothetical protein